jgi:hypothetical protein
MLGTAVSSVRLLLLLLATLLAAGCTIPNPHYDPGGDGLKLVPLPGDGGLQLGDGAPDAFGPSFDQQAPTTKPKGVDVLLVVDNSYGMSYAQEQLADEIEELLSGLAKLPGGPNYRLGVVTTDIGVGPHTTSNCSPGGDEGRLKAPSGCPLTGGQQHLVVSSGAKNTPVPPAEAAACLVQQGTSGCGFEQPLEALRLALTGNKGFLRASAALAVVVVTNEDDCSAKSQGLFDYNDGALGPYADYRCFQHGVLCSGKKPPLAAATVSSCKPGQSWLHPVTSRYVNLLKGLKPAGWVSALVLAAPTNVTYQVSKSYDKYGYPLYRLDPTCYVPNKVRGTPGVRLGTFAKQLGDGGIYGEICASSYRPLLAKLVARIGQAF